jgi:hypothetical protein
VEQGQQELAVLGQDFGELLGIERAAAVGAGDDVVRLGHRWWLLYKGTKTPDDTASSSAGAATDLSTFHYEGDIIPKSVKNRPSQFKGSFFAVFRGCLSPLWEARTLTLWVVSDGPDLLPANGSSLSEIAVLSGPIRAEPIG